MERYTNFTRILATGAPAPNATITVYNSGTPTLASIYSDDGVTPQSNPFTSSSVGLFYFYAANGLYDVQVSGAGITTYTIGAILLDDSITPPPSTDVILPTSTWASLPAAGNQGTLYELTDRSRGIVMDTGTQWVPQNSQIFNVQDFGAKGDGVTDDTAAIQAAIDAMYRVVTTGGVTGVLFFPKGRYLSGTLTVVNYSAGIIIQGSGKDGTWFKLKNNTNAPLWDIGGPTTADLCTWVTMRDMSIDGNASNQAVAVPVVRVRKVDRGEFMRIYVVNSKSHGFQFTSVSDSWCLDLESYGNTGSGFYVDACSTFFMYNCSTKQNTRYHTEVVFLNTGMTNPSTTDKRNCSVYVLGGSSEDDALGCVLNTTAWNTQVAQLRLAPPATSTVAIEIAGTAEFCTIWGNRSQLSRNDTASTTGGANPVPYFVLKLGSQTANCQYWGNPLYHNGYDGATDFNYREQILDQGANYCMEREYFQPRMTNAWFGSGFFGTIPTTVTNVCLRSRALSAAPWTATAGVSVTGTGAHGNPFGAGTANLLDYAGAANTLGAVYQDIAVTINAGERWCFSVYLLCPSWNSSKSTDFQIRVTDNTSGALLSCTDVRANANWERYGTSFIAQGSYTNVRVGIYKINGTGSQSTIAATMAQFSLGDLYTPFIETAASTVAMSAGCGMSRATIATELAFTSTYPTATTVGAAGGASALPATPTGYLWIYINGTGYKVPYYAG